MTAAAVASPVTTEAAPAATARGLALRDSRTVVPGLLPFGVLLGITVVATGGNRAAGLLGGPVIFGGSAQLTALSLLDRGLGPLAVVLSAAVVNARLLLYSAALGDRFRAQPGVFRWLAPHLLIDQTYLMATARPELPDRDFRRYWTWLGGTALVVWSGSLALGVVLAPLMPPLPHLTLVGTAMFIGLLVPRLVDRPAVVAAVVGGGVAAAVSWVLPAAGIVAGAVAGVAAAMAVSRDV